MNNNLTNCRIVAGISREFPDGRLSFHPILCRSRDRPAGRKVIDEGECIQTLHLRKAGAACSPRQVRQLYT